MDYEKFGPYILKQKDTHADVTNRWNNKIVKFTIPRGSIAYLDRAHSQTKCKLKIQGNGQYEKPIYSHMVAQDMDVCIEVANVKAPKKTVVVNLVRRRFSSKRKQVPTSNDFEQPPQQDRHLERYPVTSGYDCTESGETLCHRGVGGHS